MARKKKESKHQLAKRRRRAPPDEPQRRAMLERMIAEKAEEARRLACKLALPSSFKYCPRAGDFIQKSASETSEILASSCGSCRRQAFIDPGYLSDYDADDTIDPVDETERHARALAAHAKRHPPIAPGEVVTEAAGGLELIAARRAALDALGGDLAARVRAAPGSLSIPAEAVLAALHNKDRCALARHLQRRNQRLRDGRLILTAANYMGLWWALSADGVVSGEVADEARRVLAAVPNEPGAPAAPETDQQLVALPRLEVTDERVPIFCRTCWECGESWPVEMPELDTDAVRLLSLVREREGSPVTSREVTRKLRVSSRRAKAAMALLESVGIGEVGSVRNPGARPTPIYDPGAMGLALAELTFIPQEPWNAPQLKGQE